MFVESLSIDYANIFYSLTPGEQNAVGGIFLIEQKCVRCFDDF
jgi:hypothetical protein